MIKQRSWPGQFRRFLRTAFVLLGVLAAGLDPHHAPVALAQDPVCTGVHQDVAIPLTDLGSDIYIRMDGQQTEYTGGLYPNGSNTRPPAHEAAGLELVKQIAPLDANGAPDGNGKIVLISVGMSNTQREFQGFIDLVHDDLEINPNLLVVSGALGGQTAERWVDPEAQTWQMVDDRLQHAKVTPQQVQVAWVKQTLAGPGKFPDKALEIQAALEAIARNLLLRYPNIKIAFFSSRTRSYLYEYGLSPEPAAYESGFAVKWMIEKQIDGDPELNYDPARGEVKAPYLAWGPYLWMDGLNPRSDGQVWSPDDLARDCTHPSMSGRDKVAEMLMGFFKTDMLTVNWFLADASVPISHVTLSPSVAPSATPLPAPTMTNAPPTLTYTPTLPLPTRTPSVAPIQPIAPSGPPPLVVAFVVALIFVVGFVAGRLFTRKK